MTVLDRFEDVFSALLAVTEARSPQTLAAVEQLRQELEAGAGRRGPDSAAPVYPDVSAPDFHRRLQAMRSMYATTGARRALDAAGVQAHTLLKEQRFVKAYMSPGTGYNGLLLVHATGSGKTCSSISVAEMYRHVMNKPALVLTKTNVRAEFANELGNVDKAAWTAGGWSMPLGCGGQQYRRVVSVVKNHDPRALREALDAIVAKNYEFSGYDEFSNEAVKLDARGPAALRAAYSDRVIIVDEAHNLRSDVNSKRSAEYLMKVLSLCSNVKLLLLTATPMFDKPKEIEFLLNLLRLNDGRAEVSGLFDASGALIDEGALERAAQGYVSFARGSDPRAFPLRVTASEAMGVDPAPWPSKSYDGKKIAGVPLEVYPSVLSREHADLVLSLLGKDIEESDEGGQRLGPAAQASVIAFPGPDGLEFGDKGLSSVVRTSYSHGVMQLTHRGKARPFSAPGLRAHAPKIAAVVDAVDASEGIAFVYTYWIPSGAVPIAAALEERGYSRHGSPPLLTDAGAPSNGKQYVLITGRPELMGVSVKDAIKAVTRPNNADGSRIKVIIGTSTVAEGVNFQNVRSVHIVDPWWNSARAEQIVGRAIRFRSHAALPAERRNVALFYHAAMLPDGREGIDHYMYRVATAKQAEISRVLRVLRDTAVDCAWNRDQLYSAPTGEKVTIRTSQGRVVERLTGSRDGDPECFYGKCTRPCKYGHLLAPGDADATLFAPLQDDVDVVRRVLEAALRAKPRLRYEDIEAMFPGMEADLLRECLAALIKARVRMNGLGKLALFGDVYVVDPIFGVATPQAVAVEMPVGERPAQDREAVAAAFGDAALMCDVDDEFVQDAIADRAALAVVDRATMAAYLAAASGGLRDAMIRGGLLRKGRVWSPRSRECVTLTGEPADLPPFKTPAGPFIAVIGSAGLKMLSSRGRASGRDCSSLTHDHIQKLVHKQGYDGLDASVTKPMCCRVLELLLRRSGALRRPGFDSSE